MDFDSTLGFPGEGPLGRNFGFWIFLGLGLVHLVCFSCFEGLPLDFTPTWTFGFCGLSVACLSSWTFPDSCPSLSLRYFRSRWSSRVLLLSTVLLFDQVGAVGHGTVLAPQIRGELLFEGTLSCQKEDRFLTEPSSNETSSFQPSMPGWAVGGLSLDEILFVKGPDIETLNLQLEKYGRCLFKGGRPYGHYAETINAVAGKRPRVPRALQPVGPCVHLAPARAPPTSSAPPFAALSLPAVCCADAGLANSGRCDCPVVGRHHTYW